MPPEPDTLECWTATAAFATAYPQYDFGQIVLGNSYRHPPLLAKMASTLQALTGGRLILGIGAGWMESEYRAYGYPFPSAAVRLQQLGEAVQILRRMWTALPASFSGRHYQIEQAFNQPLPEPPPPIMIGAAGEQLALRLVARHADWWNLSGISPRSSPARPPSWRGTAGRWDGTPPPSSTPTSARPWPWATARPEARAAGERNAFFAAHPARRGAWWGRRSRSPPACRSTSTWGCATSCCASWTSPPPRGRCASPPRWRPGCGSLHRR